MKNRLIALLASVGFLFTTSQLPAQTESKLAALDKLPAQERQQRLLEAPKAKAKPSSTLIWMWRP